tara:strand:+ start:2344 stop:2604 length:261 start_codon:yes stop_codon:yes gene_type:complete
VYTDTLNKDLGESGYREESAGLGIYFGANTVPFLSISDIRISSPKKIYIGKRKKKMDPAERLRRYIELKYGKLSDNKKKKNVEKKS